MTLPPSVQRTRAASSGTTRRGRTVAGPPPARAGGSGRPSPVDAASGGRGAHRRRVARQYQVAGPTCNVAGGTAWPPPARGSTRSPAQTVAGSPCERRPAVARGWNWRVPRAVIVRRCRHRFSESGPDWIPAVRAPAAARRRCGLGRSGCLGCRRSRRAGRRAGRLGGSSAAHRAAGWTHSPESVGRRRVSQWGVLLRAVPPIPRTAAHRAVTARARSGVPRTLRLAPPARRAVPGWRGRRVGRQGRDQQMAGPNRFNRFQSNSK